MNNKASRCVIIVKKEVFSLESPKKKLVCFRRSNSARLKKKFVFSQKKTRPQTKKKQRDLSQIFFSLLFSLSFCSSKSVFASSSSLLLL